MMNTDEVFEFKLKLCAIVDDSFRLQILISLIHNLELKKKHALITIEKRIDGFYISTSDKLISQSATLFGAIDKLTSEVEK